MKSFKIFLEQRDPQLYDELLNEGWRDIAAGVLGTAGALTGFAFGGDTSTINKPTPTIQYVAPHHDKKTEYLLNYTYTKNGGPKFIEGVNNPEQLNNSAKKFIEFSKTDQHKQILIKSGILNNKGEPDLTWVPSFFGSKDFYNAVIEMQKEKINKPEAKPENIKYSKWTDQEKDIFIHYAKTKLVDLKKEDFKTYRPIDIIKAKYGIHADAVIERAKKAQKESPNDASVTLIDKLYDEIPVIFKEPHEFGQSERTMGFCMSPKLNGIRKSICIINPSAKTDGSLEHELMHAMQDKEFPTTSMDLDANKYSDLDMPYFLKHSELGARFSRLKQEYTVLTGKEPKDYEVVFDHFTKNHDLYKFEDIKHLLIIIKQFEELKKNDPKSPMLEKFHKYFKSNFDKYVDNQNKTKKTLV